MGEQVRVLQKGKITIPVEIRRRLAIKEGDTLTLETRGGHIVLLPPKTVPNPTRALSGLARGIAATEPVKDEIRKAGAKRCEKKLLRSRE
ncbi:MAG: AbrB/MazE/SpoVT family DNA-binding domain-containing protein [Nitrososphaerota archaeon]|nr:AbrB/MazE/SpoVT family DNA-binding domain-containing protein [Candidatus Bathyarchaeota archaeon]MDW8049172.1 AbrB/MazE/SpoVT family DNA-binding domain-containing protein [Nitrososphaerota archaeon]